MILHQAVDVNKLMNESVGYLQLSIVTQKLILILSDESTPGTSDINLASLMTYMETTWNIPYLDEPRWAAKSEHHAAVISLYRRISELRNL